MFNLYIILCHSSAWSSVISTLPPTGCPESPHFLPPAIPASPIFPCNITRQYFCHHQLRSSGVSAIIPLPFQDYIPAFKFNYRVPRLLFRISSLLFRISRFHVRISRLHVRASSLHFGAYSTSTPDFPAAPSTFRMQRYIIF